MSDEANRPSSDQGSSARPAPREEVVAERIGEMSEAPVRGSINVVGYHLVSVENTPDMGGFPAPEPTNMAPAAETPPPSSSDSSSSTEG
jgi:hypothetical protein